MKNRIKYIYNLEFPSHCNEFDIFGYKFKRVDDYKEKVKSIQHLISVHSEFSIDATTGNHAITAFVKIPTVEKKAVLDYYTKSTKALKDILLLLSLFNGREIFCHEKNRIIVADPREYGWGRLNYAIPYKRKRLDEYISYNIGFEEGLNAVYSLIRTKEWLLKYDHGFFLFILNQAFKRQSMETTFILCWSVWEQLFTLHNRKWLSDEQIRNLPSSEKISFILVEYAIRNEISSTDKIRIRKLANIRNRLVHYGKFPDKSSIHDAELFIRLTQFVILKILGLFPSDIFNTIDRLQKFLTAKK